MYSFIQFKLISVLLSILQNPSKVINSNQSRMRRVTKNVSYLILLQQYRWIPCIVGNNTRPINTTIQGKCVHAQSL